MVELLDRFTPDSEENPELYDLLRQGLGWASEARDLALAARYYELHLLGLAGYQPQLQRCVLCGATLLPEDQFFSTVEGGVVCPRSAQEPSNKPQSERSERASLTPLSLNGLKLLRYIQNNRVRHRGGRQRRGARSRRGRIPARALHHRHPGAPAQVDRVPQAHPPG